MNRDLIIGLLVAVLLHGGLVLGGDWLKGKPAPAPVDNSIPVIELAPLPTIEPELVELPEPAAEGGGDISDLVPPMQADTPTPTASSFVQQIQPPPPPGISSNTRSIVIPGRPGNGIGYGLGGGFKNLFDLASLDQPPVPIVTVLPIYPHEMRRAGIKGEATVTFIVDSEGNVRNPSIISSNHREFEANALIAIAKWKFKPGRKNGANVSTSNVRLPFIFNIPAN